MSLAAWPGRAGMTLTVGSLFAGIGGLELGLEMAGGFETIWQAESNPYALAVLAKHWPTIERFNDVRRITRLTVSRPDVLCGGFPCQPHSVAGARGASDDDRDLWPEFERIIRETRPRWVVAENVRGLLSSRDPAHGRPERGAFFGRILADLARLGFDAEWHSFEARDVGAPHIRQRVFIVAWRADMGHAERDRQPTGRPDHPEHDGPVAGTAGAHAGILADPDRTRQQQPARAQQESGQRAGDGREKSGTLADPDGSRLAVGASVARNPGAQLATAERGGDELAGRAAGSLPDWAGGSEPMPWPVTELSADHGRAVERDFYRVAYGVSDRVHRIARLGNAVVPQAAQVIGRAILEAEAHLDRWGIMPDRVVRDCHLLAGVHL